MVYALSGITMRGQYFVNYQRTKGHEWADEDLKAMMIFLTRKPKPGGNATWSGYLKLRDIASLHTETVGTFRGGDHRGSGKAV